MVVKAIAELYFSVYCAVWFHKYIILLGTSLSFTGETTEVLKKKEKNKNKQTKTDLQPDPDLWILIFQAPVG